MVTKIRRYDVPRDTGERGGGREGASQALKLGYQAALPVTTLPRGSRCNPNSRRVSLRSRTGERDKRLLLERLQPRFCLQS